LDSTIYGFCVILALLLQVAVKTDFPGGSARVESVEGTTVKVLPALHPDRGWTCWWYFRVEGATPGETLTLDVGGGVWATPDRAVVSADDRAWVHTAPGTRAEKGRIRYELRAPAATFWAAWGPPFTLRHANELLGDRTFELCKSRDGRSVPALRIKEGEPKHAIWVQARQHAWESGGSWVGRGFAEWLSSDDARAVALRKTAEVVYVPIMDVDNVERGAGGKEGKPQDHNRDWSDDPHWPEVRAAQAQIKALGSRFRVFVDLHNPGAADKAPYFYTSPRSELGEASLRNLDLFVQASLAEITGPLALSPKLRESGPAYDKNWERISKNWVSRTSGDGVVAVTLETSWNTPASTTENYRRVGRELGLALERYLRN
jgi:hypothetical protein